MATNKKHGISKHAYLELRYFCLQYRDFKRQQLLGHCGLIEQAALEAGAEVYQPLLSSVTTGVTYEQMQARGAGIPCGRRQFYERRREFFRVLNGKKRGQGENFS